MFGKQECRGMFPSESMYVPLYMCVIKFFSETTGPMKPKCMWNQNRQGQLLEGVECHIYLYCFTFDDINLNRALVIIVLFPTKYSNKKVCANNIRK